jgi:alkylation response protein AidB-like acyl-CoA dehydrogenase
MPGGPKGISLFLVPKFLVNADGSLGARNPATCGSIEHKMGIQASATCVMNFDEAVGYLVGEPNKGLAAMFTMMNYERLGVGIQGLARASAYQNAIEYARDRLQSRAPTGPQAKDKAADPIIVHPDVRRMLLTMKALNEGGRAFSTYVAMQLDMPSSAKTPPAQAREDLVALLTPVAKAFLTDLGLETTVHGQQVFRRPRLHPRMGPGAAGARCASPRSTKAPTASRRWTWWGKIVGSGGAFYKLFADEIRQFTATRRELAEFTKPLNAAWTTSTS